jgi:retron-type reverse transcriptase
MAKGRAGGHRNQSTHTKEKNVPHKSVSSSLIALNQKAQRDKKHRFRNLYALLNLQALYESFASLRKNAAPGVDGVTYDDYQQNLDENLQKLLTRRKCKSYRAPHVKRCFIPKAGGKLRPLGLPTLENNKPCLKAWHQSIKSLSINRETWEINRSRATGLRVRQRSLMRENRT